MCIVRMSLPIRVRKASSGNTKHQAVGSADLISVPYQLWKGEVETAIGLLRGASEWVRNPTAVEDLIGYLEERRAYIPDYEERQRAGLWIASTRVEKFNDWAVSARCKHRGMSWSPSGVLALAALEAARRNGELDEWRRGRALPERPLPEPVGQAA
jgi:hypothetical protein